MDERSVERWRASIRPGPAAIAPFGVPALREQILRVAVLGCVERERPYALLLGGVLDQERLDHPLSAVGRQPAGEAAPR